MEGKIRKLFPGGNTANGSFNFFDNIIQNKLFALSLTILDKHHIIHSFDWLSLAFLCPQFNLSRL